MGIVGGRRAVATALAVGALLSSGLAGCSGQADGACAMRDDLRRLDGLRAAQVGEPGPDRAVSLTLTYDGAVDDTAGLAALVSEVGTVAADHGCPSYRLTLVPALAPGSELTVEDDFGGRPRDRTTLRTWLRLTDALLGSVSYAVDAGAETIRVHSEGGTAHDLARAQRIGHGTDRTVWVFDGGAGTFVVTGRVTGRDLRLFWAVQRSAGAEDQPVWAPSWQLDRRADHVRLDLTVDLAAVAAPGRLTVARHGRAVAPLVRTAMAAIRATGLPAWLRLHTAGAEPDDVFGSWASDQPAERGRDPLDRGWDAWLDRRAAG